MNHSKESLQADLDELQHIKGNIIESIENGLSVRKSLVDELHLHRELDIAVILTRLDRACKEREADLDALADALHEAWHDEEIDIYNDCVEHHQTPDEASTCVEKLRAGRPQRVRDILAARRTTTAPMLQGFPIDKLDDYEQRQDAARPKEG